MIRRRSLQALSLVSLLGSLSFCGGDDSSGSSPAAGASGQGASGAPLAGAAGQGGGGPGASGSSGQSGSSGYPAAGGTSGGGQGEGGAGASGAGQGGAAGEAGQGGAAGGGQAGAAGQAGAPPGEPANVIFILADDFSWNLVEHMKNLQTMRDDGVTFSNFIVTDSLCCPSRSSIFTGKVPHNTGVFTNVGSDGGYDTYLARKNDDVTFAVSLQQAGYRTAMGGKFMNGYNLQSQKPKGWTDIFLTGAGYENYDYGLRQQGPMFSPSNSVVDYGHQPKDYLTDVMLTLGKQFINDAKGGPFLLEIATFTPHAPFTPAPRHADLFKGLEAPKPPSFNKKPSDAPPWLKAKPAITAQQLDSIEKNFRNRVRSVQAIDELIGELRALVASSPKLRDRTYIVFSSDNGFHLGEHALSSGKMTAYSTDVRVPLIVVGPGVPAGKTVPQIAQNIDLCPTFAELARTDPPAMADGRSLVPLLLGQAPGDWRDAGLVEHHHADPDPGDPDVPDPTDPPDYAALRTRTNLYVRYTGSGFVEFYDLESDPHEMKNIAASLSAKEKTRWQDWLQKVRSCKGPKECWAAMHEPK